MLSVPGRPHEPGPLGVEELLREPRTTKSFRDAGDRIVREDSALPPSVSRLLGAPALSARSGTTDADAWDVRLAALATLAQYDGLTFVNLASSDEPAAYNLVDDPTADPAIRGAIDDAARSTVTAQLRASVPLADGRLASAVLVTPLAPSEGFSGALVAFRVGRPFAAVDAHTAVGIAELVSLELARSITAQREAADRRQALALYEIARHALFTEDLDETLQSIAMVIASALDHDAAHVWLRRPDRLLRRHAAHPTDRTASEVVRENDHGALWGALHERRLVRLTGVANAAWIPSNTREVLVVPLRSEPRPLGILVLARAQAPYGLDDIEMGDVLGTFIGRVVASAASRQPLGTSDRATEPKRPVIDLEDDAALVGPTPT
jgi:GAF domain-containing protein